MSTAKRLLDFIGAACGLTLFMPVLVVVSLAIRLRTGGPVFFRQQRPGLHGEPFFILKFCTMDEQRDERGQLLQDTKRITPLGRWLRSTSLDELPTLFNVLRGDMSLVGPRPLLMKYLERYSAEQSRRHDVRPGITGLAQVKGRNAITWPRRLRYDVWYVDHQSLGLDFWVMARTIGLVLRRTGVNASVDETMPEFEGDAQRPTRIYLSPPDVSSESRELLLDAYDSNWIAPVGPHLGEFEREFADYLGGGHAVALSSGTAALHLALIAAGVGPGDEVATSSLTFAATANAIHYVGAKPVFIDSNLETWNMDPELLAQELETAAQQRRPIKAVLAVDMIGQCADYAAIRPLCDFYELPLIEDAAESLGATYEGRPAGVFGDIGCFSFNGNKIITTSGGGMLFTRCAATAERVRHLATQARENAAHYEHKEIGYNYRLSNLLAAVGRGQLQVLDDRVQKRRAIFERYRLALGDLAGLSFMPEIRDGRSSRWLTCIVIDPVEFGATREDLRLALERANIESRPIWKPMHRQPAFADCRARGGEISEQLFEHGLCLPSGSSLTELDVKRVTRVIRQMANRRERSSNEDWLSAPATTDGAVRTIHDRLA